MPVYAVHIILSEEQIDQLEKVAVLENHPPSTVVQDIVRTHLGSLFRRVSRAPTTRFASVSNEFDEEDKTPVAEAATLEELEEEIKKMTLLLETLRTAAVSLAKERDVAKERGEQAERRVQILEATVKQLRSELELFQVLS